MVIFNSYVKLPEGTNPLTPRDLHMEKTNRPKKTSRQSLLGTLADSSSPGHGCQHPRRSPHHYAVH